jgi:hypothetical protein
MTWTMRAAERFVPWHAKGRLPPKQITESVLSKLGVKHKLDRNQRSAATIVAHYGFGTAAGGLLGLLAAKSERVPRPLCGAIVGTMVWAASYAGWLPAIGIRRHAATEPAGRNAQMIAAHLVWGCLAGALLDRLSADKNEG